MKLKQAVEEVLTEDPRTRKPKYDWLLFYKVLEKLGFSLTNNWDWRMPHPESITRARREIVNTENKFPEDFDENADPTITFEHPEKEEVVA